MTATRRRFLRVSCSAMTAAALSSTFERFGLVSALAAPAGDYRALVCIYLDGGNDGNNTVVPNETSDYGRYSAVRGGSLALPQSALLPITPSSLGIGFGLHPSLTGLHELWQQQKLAIVCNVGSLVEPLTRTTFRNGSAARPYQLFSHSDQSQAAQTARADTRLQVGWGGLVAEKTLAFNGGIRFPPVTSVAGTVIYAQGAETRPLALAPAPTPLTELLVLRGYDGSPEASARRNALDLQRTIDRQSLLVSSGQDIADETLVVSQAFTSDPQLTTTFPSTGIGRQLEQVAKLMRLNQVEPRLGLRRQIFFCQLGGFDTHQAQKPVQSQLLSELSGAMKAFYDATVELGVSHGVTTFTMSDFGRTLQPSGGGGSVGSDHGWGNHLFVMGDSVRGGDFYGVPGPGGSVYPILALGGESDADSRGRWIPTAAIEQYAATLASWFGLSHADVRTVFPLIGRFSTENLGFMSQPKRRSVTPG
jgi:uncharacterized protein (DUF1501 family)